MSRAAHEATTRHLGALYPFGLGQPLGVPGPLIGRDHGGQPFCFDPFACYRQGLVTNPNVVVFGQLGRGKSALVKTLLWRLAVFGRRAWVVDPKGEYGPLAEALGARPIRLRPAGTVRLNPLDAPKGDDGDPRGEDQRRAALIGAVAEATLGRALSPQERAALALAVEERGRREAVPTLPGVVAALLAPTAEAAARVGTDPGGLAAEGRAVALELHRLVDGDLRGLFDGPTSAGLDLQGPCVVLDVSALFRSAALGPAMVLATAWLEAQLPTVDGGVVLVVDEAWAVLADLGVARWLQATWKLARARGVAHVAVLHRVSDLLGAGGPEHERLALGLLADSETRVVYAQAPGELAAARELLGLSSTEARLVPHLGRGRALWKVGGRSLVVQHLLGPADGPVVGTDAAMPAAPTSAASGAGR
ncbi:VirB4 family type IV secretion system protein [Aciditerrimonas ferrireducens]|uniref:VirB4 family type IV secretion system protein n=1 Tax=Aciditerrimonas ferrireducens TaxID=667306 RepID=UPI002006BA80|nr:ATP-binding protein [Aciditerrimonas ferrireducens]MCK4177548.1 ATP-binding protein [Aciditerrimonas ferrireducens]